MDVQAIPRSQSLFPPCPGRSAIRGQPGHCHRARWSSPRRLAAGWNCSPALHPASSELGAPDLPSVPAPARPYHVTPRPPSRRLGFLHSCACGRSARPSASPNAASYWRRRRPCSTSAPLNRPTASSGREEPRILRGERTCTCDRTVSARVWIGLLWRFRPWLTSSGSLWLSPQGPLRLPCRGGAMDGLARSQRSVRTHS